ncbi:MAG: hypothetical protein ACRDN8_09930 [Thermoleophilaceae bacterium]
MSRPSKLLCAAAVLAAGLSGCTEVETEPSTAYEPSKLSAVAGSDDLQRVTFTAEGARRTGLETASVGRRDGQAVVPYAALIYDAEGKTYVYTSPKHRTYLREQVAVARVEGERVLLSRGPPAGTAVVTVGAAEVYGAELEVASK